jgi:hypothetical protein
MGLAGCGRGSFQLVNKPWHGPSEQISEVFRITFIVKLQGFMIRALNKERDFDRVIHIVARKKFINASTKYVENNG